jgi:hypothetical protein
MRDSIQSALTAPPDHSCEFTNKIKALRDKVETAIGAPVYHEPEMNYSVSQRMYLYFDESGRQVEEDADSRVLRLDFLMSSRAPLYTSITLVRIDTNEWQLGSSITEVAQLSAMHRILQQEGYEFVHGQILEELVSGAVTEMDGVPATVFEVLFTELV